MKADTFATNDREMSAAVERRHWSIAELPWDRFDPSKIDPEMLKLVKAAALVEYNAQDYETYLCNVFADDAAFQDAVRQWSREETQHGEALGAWAERADPSFRFKPSFNRFLKGYRIDVSAQTSVRGSRAGELVARCIVETGTSSYYTALADATDEPVLKAICRNIAADEFRHYRLFHDHLKIYLGREKLGRLARARIGLGRMQEASDDELAFAYFAANMPADAVFDREACATAYGARAWRHYRREHVVRVVGLVFKACGFKPHGLLRSVANKAAWWGMAAKARRAG